MAREETWLRSFPSREKKDPFPSTDARLLARVADGGDADRRAALDELCRIYYKPIYRFFERALRVGQSDLADIVQEFFRALIEDDLLRRFRRESSFRVFLKGVCRNKCKQWLERVCTRRRIEGAESLGGAFEGAVEPDAMDRSIDDSFRRFYMENALERTRHRLGRKRKELQYRILVAVIQPDHERRPSYGELAELHGVSLSDVRNALYESRRVFRDELLAFARERSRHPEDELRALGFELGTASRRSDRRE